MRRFIFAGTFVAAALFLSASTAQAATICNSCDYMGNPGTYLGILNPVTNDEATFDHQNTATATVIDDRWVFDIAPAGNGSASADFTLAAPFSRFRWRHLWWRPGSACAASSARYASALAPRWGP